MPLLATIPENASIPTKKKYCLLRSSKKYPKALSPNTMCFKPSIEEENIFGNNEHDNFKQKENIYEEISDKDNIKQDNTYEKNDYGKSKPTNAKLPLPPMLPQDCGKMTVVLDMDETLIHSIFLKDIADQIPGNTKKRNKSIHTLDEPMIIWRLKQEADMILDVYGGVAVFLRPGVHRFLYKLSEICEVVLWTAGQKEYAEEVLHYLDPDGEFIPIHNRLYRNDTIEGRDKERLKDLRLLGRDMKRTMLIDNSLDAVRAAPNNTLLVEDFFGDPCDEQLESIWDFVSALDDLSDIRPALKMSLKASGVLEEKYSQRSNRSKGRR